MHSLRINHTAMNTQHFIAGDWGTSNLRLYLCQFDTGQPVSLLETRHGPGISEVQGDFSARFFNLAQDWIDQHGAMPVILSGMVGSNIGWKEAPYLSCPVDARAIADGRVAFTEKGLEFSILAGVRTQNPLGTPDVMRGEELQLLGWLCNNPKSADQPRLFTLPGTHNKWTWVVEQRIENFITAYTGELFGLLRRNSILISDDSAISFNPDVFMEGVQAIKNLNGAHLVHALFGVRSRQVLGEMASADGLSYLSGLLAGADVMGALQMFDQNTPVTVIGEAALTQQYLMALTDFGVEAESCDPAAIALGGFETIYRQLYIER